MLSVRLLGPPQLELDRLPLRVTRRKSRALTYYLAAHDRPVSREHLLGLFWPDHDRHAAQQILRTTLHGLRQLLGPSLLVADDSLALAPDSYVDAREFETRLAPAALASLEAEGVQAALSLYRGEFLDSFSLPDCPAFEDWAAIERERHRRLMVRGLTALSRLRESQGDYAAALEALDRGLSFDPLQEDLARAALRLHYLAGDRSGAIRRYEAFRHLLDGELGVPPMPETRALYDAIITDSLPAQPDVSAAPRRARPAVPEAAPLPFTGRAAELHAMRVAAAAHKLVLLEGEPGIGKTRLAEAFIRLPDGEPASRSARPVLSLEGAAHELESALPYHPLIEALRRLLNSPQWPGLRAGLDLPAVWLAEASRLLPELGSAPERYPVAAGDDSRLWEALHQLLVALGRRGRVILFLDDLHWADPSTLALLGYLVRRAEADRAAPASPVIYLAAARPAPPRSPLEDLLLSLTREERLARLPLSRLTQDEMLELARHLSPEAAHPLATWLTQASEGNPYVLAELVRYARTNELLRPNGKLNLSALSSAPVVPQSIYTLIQSRLARLSGPARRVLDTAVAAGRQFEFEIVSRAAGLSESAVLDALDELRAAGLIIPLEGLHFTFDHSLTMEVAYREVGEARHRLLHRRVAEALEGVYSRTRLDAVAGLLAWHFLEGQAPQRAAPYALRAGQLASGLASWKEAEAFYEQALAGTDESDRGPILMALGEARLQAGGGPQAAEAFRAALAVARGQGAASAAEEAQLALARSYLTQARFAEAIQLARELGASPKPEVAMRAEFVWGAALSVEGADLVGAAEHLQASERLTHQAGAAGASELPQIKFEQGSVAAQQGDLPKAVALYRQALAAAVQDGTPASMPYRILAHNNLAYHLHLLGDPTATEFALAGLALAHEQGALSLLPYLYSTLGEIEMAADDLAQAESHFNEGLALATRLSIPERIAGLNANLGRLAQRRGETPLAIHRLSTALARADALGVQHLAAQIRLWLVPLLPETDGRLLLAEARSIAERGNRRTLLEQIAALEAVPSPRPIGGGEVPSGG